MLSSAPTFFVLSLVCGIGSGLIGGVFFAFSTFIMRALARLPAREGIAAMQSINVVVLNPWFLGAFMGTAITCLAAVVMALVRWDTPGAACALIGGALYVLGTFVVTAACNVPRNDALAKVSPDDANAADAWTRYVQSWTAWNHVRTIAALAAAVLFSVALALPAPG